MKVFHLEWTRSMVCTRKVCVYSWRRNRQLCLFSKYRNTMLGFPTVGKDGDDVVHAFCFHHIRYIDLSGNIVGGYQNYG